MKAFLAVILLSAPVAAHAIHAQALPNYHPIAVATLDSIVLTRSR